MMLSFNQQQADKPVVKITGLTSDEPSDLKFQPVVIKGGKSATFPPAQQVAKVTINLDPDRLVQEK